MSVAMRRPEDAMDYDRTMGAWSGLVAERFLDWLRPGRALDWLDLGCGTGALTEAVHRQSAPRSLFGLDPAEAFTGFARRRPVGHFAQFAEGVAEDLPFGAHSFDAVVMGLVVCHLPQPRKALSDIRRLLRPGGFMAAYVWALPDGGHPLAELHDVARHQGLAVGSAPSASVCTRGGLEALWLKAGLEDVRTQPIEVTQRFADFRSLWAVAQLCAACTPALRCAPPAEVRAVGEAYRSRLGVDASAPVTLTARAWAVSGVYRGRAL